MSNRTLVELNHDFCPNDKLLLAWAKQMQTYMRSGDRAELPYGVKFKHSRHHSDPEPMASTKAELLALAQRLIAYFPKGKIDPKLDADIAIRQMARDAIRKAGE